ncbi:hypothetical protein A3C23_02675 [Candidatus Roizmanbacteria bacterium RIFCSPHIGHO2_02_FULL_37_13b]|uniref:Uncharacterized protein n=1 Tax=Candidatus Roizmanbacteria bacterium RIFCSPLOWO2_02_FULL_36_11 TaxID=1802071 RepID=A0A1F7JG39_9BACT|nr:MAG: hypothetical protein A3C23_02675 [Candidatus Roizmanbacteria bacterium RIFCSPHIGHO2_02_FULL_37_13b]OGK54579.1 MAG: hypothetical protein A3H78_01695 [Candidatus Roizmanbacteria bacterium RIFCSPLOWO2_02_FULL_36_11]
MKNKQLLAKLISIFLSFNLISFNALPTLIFAADMPNSDTLKQQIIDKASTKTDTINADTSKATGAVPTQPPATNSNTTNTGDNVNNTTSTNNDQTTQVNNTTDTTVNQDINAEANTGDNTTDGNISIYGTGAGVIDSGDATINATGVVKAGNNETTIIGSGNGGSAGSNVVNTGNSLTTSTNANNSTTTMVNSGNTTVINQNSNLYANTGGNRSRGNIAIGGGPAGAVYTGNATVNSNFLVTANGNVTLIGGTGGNGPGNGASIILANSGNRGYFFTRANTTHFILVNNSNRALVSQTCGYPVAPTTNMVDASSCAAITGGNNSSANIAFGGDAGRITTGNATVNVTMVADVNNNSTTINGAGSGSSANSDVLNTGNDVNIDTTSNNTSNTTVNNRNSATINQRVNAKAITGKNIANGNISFGGCAGCITTGDATVNVTLVADVNNNKTLIDNGSLNGNVGGSNSQVVNTGDDVKISTETNNNTQITSNSTNFLDLAQNVFGRVITGFVKAIGNIGRSAGIIVTGDAELNVNQKVTGNNNETVIIDPVQIGGAETANPTPTPQQEVARGGTTDPVVTNNSTTPSNPSPSNSSTNSTISSSSVGSVSDGDILGAATAILPASGPELLLWILAIALSSLILGNYLRNYKAEKSS